MRVLKAILVTLLAGGIIFISASCAGGANAAATAAKPTISTVQRGNISIAVIGTGNLALEYKQMLSFGQTGLVSNASNAKISDVLVKEGDTVEQGQVLAKADTSDLQDQLTQDQHQLDNAKYNLQQAQNSLATDQMKLVQQTDVADIQTKIDKANTQIQTIQANYDLALKQNISLAPGVYKETMDNYKLEIARYQKQMADLLADPAHYLASQSGGSAASANTIKNLQMAIQQDQNNIILKQNAVDDAQTALDNDKGAAQEIVAPFKGLITKVTITQGDIVQRNADLIEIAQPEKFVANILVTERDVMSVKLGGDATVSFDALSGLNFPAKITQIAPLATVQQGVVNYKVTVELTSLRPVFPNRTGATGQRPQGQGTASAGSPSVTGTPRATPTGTPTPRTSPTGTTAPTGTANVPTITTGGTPPAGQFQSVTLKDGLSATVNIIIQEKDSVLMVPSRAITRTGQNNTVMKVVGTGTEQTTVQIGITDGTNTEIASGLNEGDQVSIQPRPAATTTNQNRPPGGAIRLP